MESRILDEKESFFLIRYESIDVYTASLKIVRQISFFFACIFSYCQKHASRVPVSRATYISDSSKLDKVRHSSAVSSINSPPTSPLPLDNKTSASPTSFFSLFLFPLDRAFRDPTRFFFRAAE